MMLVTSAVVAGTALATTCYCTEVSSACNGFDFNLGPDQCIFEQDGVTAMFAMPYNNRGDDDSDDWSVTSTCKYRLGKYFEGLCISPGDTQEAEVSWSVASGVKCAQSCN
jgi:hypothetical protein